MRDTYATMLRQKISHGASFADTRIGVDIMDVYVLLEAATQQTADGQMMGIHQLRRPVRIPN